MLPVALGTAEHISCSSPRQCSSITAEAEARPFTPARAMPEDPVSTRQDINETSRTQCSSVMSQTPEAHCRACCQNILGVLSHRKKVALWLLECGHNSFVVLRWVESSGDGWWPWPPKLENELPASKPCPKKAKGPRTHNPALLQSVSLHLSCLPEEDFYTAQKAYSASHAASA